MATLHVLLVLLCLRATSARNDMFPDDHNDEQTEDEINEHPLEPLPAKSVWDHLADQGELCGGSTGDTCLRGYGALGGDREFFLAIDAALRAPNPLAELEPTGDGWRPRARKAHSNVGSWAQRQYNLYRAATDVLKQPLPLPRHYLKADGACCRDWAATRLRTSHGELIHQVCIHLHPLPRPPHTASLLHF